MDIFDYLEKTLLKDKKPSIEKTDMESELEKLSYNQVKSVILKLRLLLRCENCSLKTKCSSFIIENNNFNFISLKKVDYCSRLNFEEK